jgi:hypothetical protein
VQFGYALEFGTFCLQGQLVKGVSSCLGESALILGRDVRWEWQYWPSVDGQDFYYEIGPENSAGLNGTWHQYEITTGAHQSISFVLDQNQVAEAEFELRPSESPPMVVAEKVTPYSQLGSLGPVEFRDLEYFENQWKPVDSLVSLSGCGISVSCTVVNPYGVASEGANQIIAGSNVQVKESGRLLWTSSYVTLSIIVHPGVQFHVTTISADEELSGSSQVDVPKGMFAEVWLSTTSVRTEGFLGWIGATDYFQGWAGNQTSGTPSVRVLMDRNQSLQANWHTDLSGVVVTLVVAFLSLAILVLGALRFSKHPQTSHGFRLGANSGKHDSEESRYSSAPGQLVLKGL